MLGVRERFSLSISEIEYSDMYDKHSDLFDNGIDILTNRLEKNDFSEFTDEEQDILVEIYSIINND